MIEKLQNHDRQLHFDVRNIERMKSNESTFVKPVMCPKPSPEKRQCPISLLIIEILKNVPIVLGTYLWSGHAVLLKKTEPLWQDREYVLSIFGNERAYLRFIEKGIDEGQRPDLTGGGLVRSNGGWKEIKKSQNLVKGDERILGDSSFVMNILAQAEEKLERRYAIKKAGIDITAIEKRVCDLLRLEVDQLYDHGRYRQFVEARSLFCYWAHSDLGISGKDLSSRFSISEPAVSYAIRRGQNIARERGYALVAATKKKVTVA